MGRPAYQENNIERAEDIRRGIIRHFERAAGTYDAAASLQARVAARLAGHLREAMPAPASVLEFGCGTGQLTRLLKQQWPQARVVASDIAQGMVKSCARHSPAHALVMDAEAPAFAEQSFDVVCGSLAAQWFLDGPSALRGLQRLLKPGGVLGLTTLGPGTLKEWHAACASAGVQVARYDYPSLAELAAARSGFVRAEQESVEAYTEQYPGGLALLSSLRSLGADMRPHGSRPFTPGELRRAIAQFDRALNHSGKNQASFQVITLLLRREAPPNFPSELG